MILSELNVISFTLETSSGNKIVKLKGTTIVFSVMVLMILSPLSISIPETITWSIVPAVGVISTEFKFNVNDEITKGSPEESNIK